MANKDSAWLTINDALHRFLVSEALPGTGIEPSRFFQAFSEIVHDLAPRNELLLAKRNELQRKIDQWHRAHPGNTASSDYESFLREIGYIVPEGEDFIVATTNVDPEIATIAGPQLVVPVMNARYALNAVNARWGSLYDALYGTDAIPIKSGANPSASYDPERGRLVVEWARDFLDRSAPLSDASWKSLTALRVANGALHIEIDGKSSRLSDENQFVGYRDDGEGKREVLFRNNGLLVAVVVDPTSEIGRSDRAGVSDIRLESAITTIMDCEDSVAAVDSADKVAVYRNWLGLMKGDLSERVTKGVKTFSRTLNADREYLTPAGGKISVKARSLMLVRNVGHLMTNPAIRDRRGRDVPEGIMDAMITALIALHDVGANGRGQNSSEGSIYVVKPKMHGPEEVAFADELFSRVEEALGLARNTIKIGIMDEERRTTVNLKECIRAAKDRVVFINTGFLDRTGDEIHTSMEAGPMLRKGDMKQAAWLAAYENWNVDTGLACGLSGRAQIGKGMWAMPDLMAAMLEQKIAHPRAGASTAWVPSPTAATLHATHYHSVDVATVQEGLKTRTRAKLEDILTIPIAIRSNWSAAEIQREIDNNCQGILGYVVRWIDQGVGCSKVPDINDVGLMEDRATLRISAQHMANWLRHGIVSRQQVIETMRKMAAVVDGQNAGDPDYEPMTADLESSIAFRAALDLVLEGREQPNGYTEPLLHRYRAEKKASFAENGPARASAR